MFAVKTGGGGGGIQKGYHEFSLKSMQLSLKLGVAVQETYRGRAIVYHLEFS